MRRRNEELVFDHSGNVDVAELRETHRSTFEYEPPPGGKKWKALYAVLFMPWAGTDKAVMGTLIKVTNTKTGLCYPSHNFIIKMTGLSKRSVERAIPRLCKTGYLRAQQRGSSSNAYVINWNALNAAFDARERDANRSDKTGEPDLAERLTQNDNRQEWQLDAAKSGERSPPEVANNVIKGPSKETCYPERASPLQVSASHFSGMQKGSSAGRLPSRLPIERSGASGTRAIEAEAEASLALDLPNVAGAHYNAVLDWLPEDVHDAARASEVDSPHSGAAFIMDAFHKHLSKAA